MRYLQAVYFSLLLIVPLLSSHGACAQDSSSYKMEFVRAGWVTQEGHTMVVVMLKVTPTRPDFKLVLSMRLFYDLGDGKRSMEVKQDPDMRITVYGKDIESKSEVMYRFVKDKVDLQNEKDIYLLRFDFRDVSTERVKDMWFKYGLWEGENDEVRHEQEFRFPVDDLTK